MVRLWLDSMIFKVFSKLSNSMTIHNEKYYCFLASNISPLIEGVGNYKEKNSRASYLFSQRTLL